mmetsp:Transcript_30998/g.97397  ORF Transcript_30998/g.97397 Transcript_30998/m.97397 type:complete len:416 (+) Transcript_30998:159-1406(+)
MLSRCCPAAGGGFGSGHFACSGATMALSCRLVLPHKCGSFGASGEPAAGGTQGTNDGHKDGCYNEGHTCRQPLGHGKGPAVHCASDDREDWYDEEQHFEEVREPCGPVWVGTLIMAHPVVAEESCLLLIFTDVPTVVRIRAIVPEGIRLLVLGIDVEDGPVRLVEALDLLGCHAAHKRAIELAAHLGDKGEGQGVHDDVNGFPLSANHQKGHSDNDENHRILDERDAQGPTVPDLLPLQRQEPLAEVVVGQKRPHARKVVQVEVREDPDAADEPQQVHNGASACEDLVRKVGDPLDLMQGHRLPPEVHLEGCRTGSDALGLVVGGARAHGEETPLVQARDGCRVHAIHACHLLPHRRRVPHRDGGNGEELREDDERQVAPDGHDVAVDEGVGGVHVRRGIASDQVRCRVHVARDL